MRHLVLNEASRVVGCPYFRLPSPKAISWPSKRTSADISRRVHISIKHQAAIVAVVCALAQLLPYHGAAARTLLRGSVGVYRDNLSASVCGFAREDAQEETPTSVVNGLGEHTSREAVHVQLFDGNTVVAVDEFSRCPVCEVMPRVGDAVTSFTKQYDGLSPSIALQIRAAINAPLRTTDGTLCVTHKAGIFNSGSVVEHREGVESEIDSTLAPRRRKNSGRHIGALKEHVPAFAFALEGGRLGQPFHLAVPLDPDRARNAVDLQSSANKIDASAAKRVPLGDLREGERVVSVRRMEARETGFLPGFDAPVEGVENSVQSFQRVLQYLTMNEGNVWPFTLYIGHLGALFVEVEVDALSFIRIPLFFECRVVEFAAGGPNAVEISHLLSVRSKVELERAESHWLQCNHAVSQAQEVFAA